MPAELPEWWEHEVAALLDNLYDGFDELKSRAYFQILGGLPPAAVITAATQVCSEARDHLPRAGVIFDRAVEDRTVPSWEQAWPVISEAVVHHRDHPDTAIAELETRHAVLGRFAAEQRPARLRALQTDHEVYGEKVRRDLANAYDDVVRRYREHRRAGMTAMTAPQLGSLRDGHSRRALAGVEGPLDRALAGAGTAAQLKRGTS